MTTSLIKNEKDKQNRTFLDRDRTEILCRRSEKIGSAIVTYATKDNPDSDNWKRTLFLYCTENLAIDGLGPDYEQLQGKIKENFYKTYEKNEFKVC